MIQKYNFRSLLTDQQLYLCWCKIRLNLQNAEISARWLKYRRPSTQRRRLFKLFLSLEELGRCFVIVSVWITPICPA